MIDPNVDDEAYALHELQSLSLHDLAHRDNFKYKPPVYDIDLHQQDYYTQLLPLNLSCKLGTKELKEQLFYLKDFETVFLNHGGGLAFKPVIKYVHQWTEYAEEQSLRFVDRLLNPLLDDIIRLYAENVFYCKPRELCIVDNCTFAFNSLLKSLRLDESHCILVLSTTYGVYRNVLNKICQEANSPLHMMQIDFPISNEDDYHEKIVQKFYDQYLAFHTHESMKIKYFIVDSIASHPAFLLPFSRLIDLCKSRRPDIVTIVDAAHGLGAIKNFNFKPNSALTRNIDFMFIGCHKWLCASKGSAFMFRNDSFRYSPSKHLVNLQPAVYGHGINKGFADEFTLTGSKNYANYLGLYAAFFVWMECLGGFEHAIDYCTTLLRDACDYLTRKWATSCLVDPLLCTTMAHVQLPDVFIRKVLANYYSNHKNKVNISSIAKFDLIDRLMNFDKHFEYKPEHAQIIQDFLYYNHDIEISVKLFINLLFVRLTAHVYNRFHDFMCLSEAVLQNLYNL